MDSLLLTKCELSISRDSFCIYAPDAEVANALKQSLGWLAAQAAQLGKRDTRLFYPGCRRPYQIPACLASTTPASEGARPTQLMNPPIDLLGADYMKILEFLMQERQDGNIVIITSNTTDICYHTNDLLLPSRAYWTAAQFTGYNYLRSWRANREEAPDSPQRLNPEYEALKELLARDGYVPNYEYTLYRPDDAKCSYSTTYFLCRDYCGDEVRIGVSRPQDWALLEAAPVA